MSSPPKTANSSFLYVDAASGAVLGRDVFHDPGFVNHKGEFVWPMHGGTALGPRPEPPRGAR